MVDRSSPRFLEVAHVAHRLSVSPEYVLRLIRRGTLRAIRLGKRYRIDPLELDRFLTAQQVSDEDDEDQPPQQLHAVPKGA